ncbi:MAG: hypothetical protein ACRDTD_09890 [Pseudonocardiaceae bacterium]
MGVQPGEAVLAGWQTGSRGSADPDLAGSDEPARRTLLVTEFR